MKLIENDRFDPFYDELNKINEETKDSNEPKYQVDGKVSYEDIIKNRQNPYWKK